MYETHDAGLSQIMPFKLDCFFNSRDLSLILRQILLQPSQINIYMQKVWFSPKNTLTNSLSSTDIVLILSNFPRSRKTLGTDAIGNLEEKEFVLWFLKVQNNLVSRILWDSKVSPSLFLLEIDVTWKSPWNIYLQLCQDSTLVGKMAASGGSDSIISMVSLSSIPALESSTVWIK